jgi:hypothetical protein
MSQAGLSAVSVALVLVLFPTAAVSSVSPELGGVRGMSARWIEVLILAVAAFANGNGAPTRRRTAGLQPDAESCLCPTSTDLSAPWPRCLLLGSTTVAPVDVSFASDCPVV